MIDPMTGRFRALLAALVVVLIAAAGAAYALVRADALRTAQTDDGSLTVATTGDVRQYLNDSNAQAQLLDVAVDRLLPDITAGGATWGSFVTTAAGPQKDQRLTCVYDKATYRVGVCKNDGLTMSFSRYDDPTNVVTVPAAAK